MRRVDTSMKIAVLVLAASLMGCGAARADEIVLPQQIERDRPASLIYRLASPASGKGRLSIEWQDAAGRLVERSDIPVTLDNATDVAIPLATERAVAMQNRIAAHLSLAALNGARREGEAAADFIVSPPAAPWSDYQIIMWQPQKAAAYAALKHLGITGAMVEGRADADERVDWMKPLLSADLQPYIENIATDFYSAYHRWSGDRPVNWRFLEARERYWKDPADRSVFVRDPSLSDPEWLRKIRDRLTDVVAGFGAYRPLFYNLADESGIADLTAAWDFDLSIYSLRAMREWLAVRYPSLAALNAQWGTDFARWDLVMPMTTDQAMKMADDNFSAWADFKAWMDVAFARAIASGTAALHAADPTALAAIEGAQVPGTGGYDYSLLASAVDAIEIYDDAENVEIVRSLNPRLILLTTGTAGGPRDAHQAWRELLRGTRGRVLWDSKQEFVTEDGAEGPRGRAAAPYFAELRDGLGALLIGSTRHTDPIAILYSPASIRTQWMIDQKPQGEAWTHRDADVESDPNELRTATANYASVMEHSGLQHRFVSSDMVEQGALRGGDFRILILPHIVALSPAEAAEIRQFAARGGLVIADREPGLYDAHSRKLPQPLLHDLFAAGSGRGILLAATSPRRRDNPALLRLIAEHGVTPGFTLARPDGTPIEGVTSYVFRNGDTTIIALLRDLAGEQAGAPPPPDESAVLTLPQPGFLYDLRRQAALGRSGRLEIALSPFEPTLLALSPSNLPAPAIGGPQHLALGATARFHLTASAASDVLHIETIDPAGNILAHYSGNRVVSGGTAEWLLPLAYNDPIGTWKIKATDLLSGASAIAEVTVTER
jgi:hypothetical protein